MALYHSFPFLSIFSSRVFSFLGFLCLVCVVPTPSHPSVSLVVCDKSSHARKILQNNLRKTHDKNTCRAQEPSRFRQHLHLRNTSTIVNLGLRAQVATVEVVVDECREYLRRRERRRERRRLRWRLERMMERRM
jgi:hypothetical protein